ncbi:DUF1905 domain-containing protein [Globicatella sanguinis]
MTTVICRCYCLSFNIGVKKKDGSTCYIIGVLKTIRQQLGKTEGDIVSVTIRERV